MFGGIHDDLTNCSFLSDGIRPTLRCWSTESALLTILVKILSRIVQDLVQDPKEDPTRTYRILNVDFH